MSNREKSEFRKRIDEVEDNFLKGEETPETVQMVFEQLLALINDEEFAKSVLEGDGAFDSIYTPSLENRLEDDDYKAEVQWEDTFTPEQEKILEDTANEKIDAYIEEYMRYMADEPPIINFPF